jgi:hypothetical protein
MLGRMRASWIVLVAIGGCSFKAGVASDSIDAASGSDAKVVDGATTDAQEVLGAWSSPVEISALNSGTGEDDPSLTSDQLEIYFGSMRLPGPDEDIFVAKRASKTDTWGTPVLAPNLSTTATETTTKVAAGGLVIYFSSNRSDPADFQLYAASRTTRSQDFNGVTMLSFSDPSLNEWGAYARPDLLRLVFCAGHTIPEEAIYVSERTSTTVAWSTPKRITELDDPIHSECDPMEPNPTTIYYSSDATGDTAIYVAHRASPTVAYSAPMRIAELDVASVQDRDPWVSADERTMIFSSNRSGVDRLYITTR